MGTTRQATSYRNESVLRSSNIDEAAISPLKYGLWRQWLHGYVTLPLLSSPASVLKKDESTERAPHRGKKARHRPKLNSCCDSVSRGKATNLEVDARACPARSPYRPPGPKICDACCLGRVFGGRSTTTSSANLPNIAKRSKIRKNSSPGLAHSGLFVW